MGAKTGAKAGRPLKQNGKTKVQEKEEEEPKGPDFSILRKPVEISVSGLSEVVKVFQNSPPELHHLLSYECDVVYECKVCRNLFRSLANFISHKRVYCTQLHGNSQNNIFKLNKRVNDTTVIVEPEPVRITRSREQWRTSDAGGAGDGKDVHEPRTRNGLAEPAPFRITVKKDLTSIVEKLMQKNSTQTLTETVGHMSSSSEFYDNVNRELAERKKDAKQHTIHLEPIENTTFGVFQTVMQSSSSSSELIKSQVQDLHRIISDTDAVLGPDGRVIENGALPHSTVFHDDRRRKSKVFEGGEYNGPPVTAPESEVELFCNLCKEEFSSFKVLNHHMKSLHMTFRTFYPCPCCKLPLSNSWSVYRHLLKEHRKTNEQIRKLREKVIKRSYKKEVLQSGAQKLIKPNVSENPLCPSELIYEASHKSTSPTEEDSYKQWFGDHDDGLGQGCGNCGRRFDRRAALLAHSQSCLKSSSVRQSSSGSGRPSVQTGIGQPPQPSKLMAMATTTSSSVSPLLMALTSPPTLPVHPLHLNQEKQAVPTKKIEIQVRRDYGKTLATNSECRTRTSSASRSDDGAASVSRSDDGTTSGSSETEASAMTDKGLGFQKDLSTQHTECRPHINSLEHSQERRPSLPDEGSTKIVVDPPVKRRVGRPRKHKIENLVNGTSNPRPPSVSISEGSNDSNDVKEKILGLSKREERRKRKAKDADLSSHEESDDDNAANSLYHSDSEHISSAVPKGSSKKVLCTICQKHFKSSASLREHLAAAHISYNRFRCLICNFRSFTKMDCVSHALKTHLESSWDKDKAVAMVQDLQMDAGGSTDTHPYDELMDSGDSESAVSDSGTPSETPEKSDDSSPDDLPSVSEVVENHSIEGVAEIIGVA